MLRVTPIWDVGPAVNAIRDILTISEGSSLVIARVAVATRECITFMNQPLYSDFVATYYSGFPYEAIWSESKVNETIREAFCNQDWPLQWNNYHSTDEMLDGVEYYIKCSNGKEIKWLAFSSHGDQSDEAIQLCASQVDRVFAKIKPSLLSRIARTLRATIFPRHCD